MSISLYDATIPTYIQLLKALVKLLADAQSWVKEGGATEEQIMQARIAPDMLDFAYQVKSAAWNSWGAVDGARKGNFSPDWSDPPQTLTAMISHVEDSLAKLEALDRAEVDSWVGRPMVFSVPGTDFRMPFVVENFLFSVSQPNFHFHVTMAYALLRGKGMKIGKIDYLGQLRAESV